MAEDSMTVQITGLDGIEKRLELLPEKLRRKAIRQALTDGTELIRDDAQARVPMRKPVRGWMAFLAREDEPHLRDAIVSRVSVTAKGASGRVGVDYKKVRHGHLVEFGTKPHRVRNFQHPGSRKQPVMRPAVDTKGDQAVDVMVSELAKAVEEEA